MLITPKQWDWVILLGVLYFLAGGVGVVLGYLGTPWQSALAVLGMILIGAATSGKRRVWER